MKNKIYLFFLLSNIFLFSNAFSQSKPIVKKYVEVNAGFASVVDIGPFPGASFLFGRTSYYPGGLVLDGEFGFAFPSIITGKLGIGLGNEDAAFLIGVRPFPITAYAQFNVKINKGTLIFSGETSNPKYEILSLNTRGNFNVGYRWNLKRKKIRELSNSVNKI